MPTQIQTTQTSKPWYTSITVWGSLIAGISAIIQIVTQTLDSSVGTHLSTHPLVMGIMTILGSIMAVIGRFNAILPIGSPQVPTSSITTTSSSVPISILPANPVTTTVTRTVITSDQPVADSNVINPTIPSPSLMNKIS